MKYILLVSTILISNIAFCQTPEDGLRTAWFTQNGTARTNAIAGAIGSLGGDISAANINPAGLAMYKTKEFVLSVGALKNLNNFEYRGTNSTNDKGVFRYGPMGIVLGTGNNIKGSNNKGYAFSISVNQLASFNNSIQFNGYNNYSSFSEQYIEELIRDNADTNAALSNYIFGSSLAFRTYLIDTGKDNNGALGYKTLVPISSGVNQTYNALIKGGYHEIAIGFASNENNKWYYGGSLTIPLVSYKRILDYSEYDATNKTNNKFGYFKFNENLQSFGVGIGLKLGAIYKVNSNVRLGLAFHTPQFIGFKDGIRASMTTNTEGLKGTLTESSNALNDNNPGERKYNVTTPYRAIASISYLFNQVANTKQQHGFVSADVEFVNYRGVRFGKTDEGGNSISGYYKTLNNAIKEIYKGNVNVKIGGELKFDPIAVRLGGAYYGSPYNDETIKADRFVLSGGLGYRKNGMFIDLSFSQTLTKDAVFPYRLNDIENTYANQKNTAQTIIMTIGFKL